MSDNEGGERTAYKFGSKQTTQHRDNVRQTHAFNMRKKRTNKCSVFRTFSVFFLSTFVRSRIPNSPAQNDAENFATHSFTISHIRIFSQCSNVSNSMAG